MTLTFTKKNAPTELDFYKRLTEGLKYTGEFGNNLDALHDLLTEPRKKFRIYINDQDFASAYGGRGEIILQVLRDASEESGCFTLKIRTKQRKLWQVK